MKQSMKRIIICSILLITTFVLISCSENDISPLQEIEGQEFINETISPDNKYTIKAYKNNGGATVDWAVLCTLTENETKKTKNIYWQYHEENAVIEWLNDDTVRINQVTLNLPDETYDWRNVSNS